ncbi:MAG: MerR family DNA-binding transcriptional regulator [Parcubacteria group bacterium]
MNKMYRIGEAAKVLGVSIQTLRRWAKEGSLVPDFISPGGHRFYSATALERFSESLVHAARMWVTGAVTPPLTKDLYCETSATFLVRLNRFSQELQQSKEFTESSSLVVAIAGEIGNNSFDHNLGNWPDVPGIFFGFDLKRRHVVLADRGQGVLKTLKRVRATLTTELQAVRVAFTERISGRAPEKRGNGLKFVRDNVMAQSLDLLFQSGDAILMIGSGHKKIELQTTDETIRGTLAVLHF